MRLPPSSNQRFDSVGSRALHYIGLSLRIAIVGQQCFGPAELFRQSVDLLTQTTRRDLLLVVGRLNHCRGDHQKDSKTSPPPRSRVVTLVEAAARHRHNPQILVRQVDLVLGLRPLDRRCGWPAASLLAIRSRRGSRAASLARCFKTPPPARERSLARASISVARACAELGQTILTARQFLRDRHAIDHFSPIRGFRPRQQFGHFGLQLGLDLPGML